MKRIKCARRQISTASRTVPIHSSVTVHLYSTNIITICPYKFSVTKYEFLDYNSLITINVTCTDVVHTLHIGHTYMYAHMYTHTRFCTVAAALHACADLHNANVYREEIRGKWATFFDNPIAACTFSPSPPAMPPLELWWTQLQWQPTTQSVGLYILEYRPTIAYKLLTAAWYAANYWTCILIGNISFPASQMKSTLAAYLDQTSVISHM